MHKLIDRSRRVARVVHACQGSSVRGRSGIALAAITAAGALLAASAVHAGVDTWTGNTTANFNAVDGFNTVPASNDSLVFGVAGSTGATLTDNLLTPASFNISAITFNSGASAFIINPATVGTNGFTLTGNITNSGTSLETINDAIAATAVRTVTLTTGGGNVKLGGSINGTGGGLTTAGAGTLTLGGTDTYTGNTTVANGTTLTFANNVLGSNASFLTNVVLGTGGITDIIDLAGTTQTFGTLSSSSTTDSGGIITSSSASGSLILNEGTSNGNLFGGTRFTGTLALTVRGTSLSVSTGNQPQLTNANSTFSGGLTIQGSTGTLTTSNLAVSGGLSTTGLTTQGLRFNSGAAIGSGTVTLDNGQLFGVTGAGTVTDNIAVTSRGGVIHDEVNGATFSGTLASTGSPLLVINSNSGNTNTLKFTGSDSGFAGTMAIDTTNIGGIALSGSALGNSNTNLLWFGTGTNGGTGQVESALATGGTLTFGELNNFSSGGTNNAYGIIENTITATTATFSIGDSNTTAATFQGIIKNNVGTVALTKTGTNTQILSGTNTYTGATTINGGTLAITGNLSSGTTVTVNSSGTLLANSTGVVYGPVNVAGGGFVGGTGSVNGLITLATGTTAATAAAINLAGQGASTFNISNAGGLTLGGTAGNLVAIDQDASSKIAVTGPLTVNTGGLRSM